MFDRDTYATATLTFTCYPTGIYVSACDRYLVVPTADYYWQAYRTDAPASRTGEIGKPQALKEDAMRLCQDHADMTDLPL